MIPLPLLGTNLPVVVQVAVCATFGVLTMASIVCTLCKRLAPARNWTELSARISTWWYLTAGFTLAIAFDNAVSIAALGLVSFIAFKEFMSCIPTRRADHAVLALAYLAVLMQYFWVYVGWYDMFIIFIPVLVFLALTISMALTGDTRGFLRSAGVVHWGVMTSGFCLSHLAYLLYLPATHSGGSTGISLLFFIVVTTQLNDVFQYLWGKAFGAHRVIPTVSPNKTWEGSLGAIATTTVLTCLAGPSFTPLEGGRLPLAGLLIGIGGFVGDIVMSAVKRDLGIKDYGRMLPGHGGILDRVDSVMLTAPLFFHYLRYFYY